MTAGRVVGTAQRLGIFAQLLEGPATAGRLAERLSLQVAGTRIVCENLAGLGILEQDGHTFSLAKSSRKWLDPASDTYLGTWVEHSVTYWEWYGDLERVVRDGGSFEIHREPAEDEEYWRLYITGQYEIARLSSAEVAKAIRLGEKPTSLLDVAGGHGWFSAELCKRHETLKATVVDLAGSARVGREIIAKAGMGDRVEHREGDMFETDLEGPYDGALVFDIIHHLSGEQIVTLLSRVRESMKPGGTLAVLDMFRLDGKRQRGLGRGARAALSPHLRRRSAQPGRARRLHARGGLLKAEAHQDPPHPRPGSVSGAGRVGLRGARARCRRREPG